MTGASNNTKKKFLVTKQEVNPCLDLQKDGVESKSTKTVNIPIVIGSKSMMLEVDVVKIIFWC